MKRILVPSAGLADWKAHLAQPDTHWKRRHSAFELAVHWEAAAKSKRGLPQQVADLFDSSTDLRDATLLLAMPEHRVDLDGRGSASRSDLWALLHGRQGLVSLAVEGKTGEPFGDLVDDWLGTPVKATRQERIHGLCQTLNIANGVAPNSPVMQLPYQLLHRTASAVLEAKRFGASQAVMLVQAFGEGSVGFEDFVRFGIHLGADVVKGRLAPTRSIQGVVLLLAWLDCPFATDEEIAHAAE